MSDDPNHHFPIKSLDDIAREHREKNFPAAHDEYMRTGDGKELREPEEVFAYLVKHGALDFNSIPDYLKAKTQDLIDARFE